VDGRAAGGDAALSMNADVHPTPADRVTNWNYEADVIVAGSGGGLVGAYTAAREGLSVASISLIVPALVSMHAA